MEESEREEVQCLIDLAFEKVAYATPLAHMINIDCMCWDCRWFRAITRAKVRLPWLKG